MDAFHSFLCDRAELPVVLSRQDYECGKEKKMSRSKNYEARTEQLLEPIARNYGVEIYDVEYVKEGSDWFLRAYIDKAEGVNIIDCENVSRALSDALDKEDFIEEAYILEVSSPGLGRTLKKDKHLEKSIGQEVEIKLYKSIDKQKDFAGNLKRFNETELEIAVGEDTMVFMRSEIAAVRLKIIL